MKVCTGPVFEASQCFSAVAGYPVRHDIAHLRKWSSRVAQIRGHLEYTETVEFDDDLADLQAAAMTELLQAKEGTEQRAGTGAAFVTEPLDVTAGTSSLSGCVSL